eukprot:2070197-Prymnesium_polylepis.1
MAGAQRRAPLAGPAAAPAAPFAAARRAPAGGAAALSPLPPWVDPSAECTTSRRSTPRRSPRPSAT